MAPKVKARAKGAARVVLRRPGAIVPPRPPRLPRRRPARAEEPGDLVVVEGGWARGEEMRLKDLSPLELRLGQRVAITEAKYYGMVVKVAGVLNKVEVEDGSVHLTLRITGTDNEDILKMVGLSSAPFVVHCCPADCGAMETGDRYLHGLKARLLTAEGRMDDWMMNLEAVPKVAGEVEDELQELRRRGLELAAKPRAEGEMVPGEEDPPAGPSKKKPKKDVKDKKEPSGKGKMLDGRHAAVAVQKELAPLFGGTGLDPEEKVRRRVMKRAQKYIKKKKSKSSSSTTTSEEKSTSNEDGEDAQMNEGLYSETGRAKNISQKFPGALCQEALRMMRETLLTEMGEDPDASTHRPVSVLYFKQELQRKGSAVQCRELINLCTALDLLVRGKPAAAADVLAQRIKACEAAILGSHWSTTQRLEIPVQEGVGMAQRSELQAAHRESYQDSRTKYLSSISPGARMEVKGKKGDKDPNRASTAKREKERVEEIRTRTKAKDRGRTRPPRVEVEDGEG